MGYPLRRDFRVFSLTLLIATPLVGHAGNAVPGGFFIPDLCQEALSPDPHVQEVELGPTLTYDFRDENNKVQGAIVASLSKDLKAVFTVKGQILESARTDNIFEKLLARLVEENPQIELFTARLRGRSLEIYQHETRSGSDRTAALMKTPLYQTLAPLGFTQIQIVSEEANGVLATISKPTNIPTSFDRKLDL
jgi:hypothetical protein